jgi:phenylalanyl-tRNA synthetase alpha chain
MEAAETIAELARAAPLRIAAATDLDELARVEAETVGKQSPIAAARRGLGALDLDERRDAGRRINDVAAELSELIELKRSDLASGEQAARLEADAVDVTLPGRTPPRGTHHLITRVMDEIVDIFVSLGYTVATGPEAETEYYNFTALNFPYAHPSRLETDTLYLDYGGVPEEVLLRTHTSPMQARYMEEHDPPVFIVVPGRVFRRDAMDATHTPVFHQVEGLAVAEDITFRDLKGTLAQFAREFFGPETKVKFLPHHFPFTEPSAEMHAFTNGKWLELLGCGMVNPAVFEYAGYDPEAVTGFAFGFGVERMAMVRYGITDIRSLYDPDVRVLEQFR